MFRADFCPVSRRLLWKVGYLELDFSHVLIYVIAAGVPVVPGYHGSNQDPDFLKSKASEIGQSFVMRLRTISSTGMNRLSRTHKGRTWWRWQGHAHCRI